MFSHSGARSFPAVPVLAKLTQDNNQERRMLALRCLGGIHPDKEVLLPILAKCSHDSDMEVRTFAKDMAFAFYFDDPQAYKSITGDK